MQQLEGRVAVVTGGGSGIGEGLVLACANAGMKVVAADLNADAAKAAAEKARATGAEALAVHVDVSDPGSVEALADKTFSEFGACHLLCNNAGVLVVGPAVERSEEEWRRGLDVNVMGVVHGVRSFVPRFRAQGGEAHVLNTASISGLCTVPAMGVYVATKFAVVGLSESLRSDLAPDGIGVTVLCPGGVKTGLIGDALREAGGKEQAAERMSHLMSVAKTTGEGAEDILDPAAVAEMALDGVRANEPFVVTHAMYRPILEERFGAILAATDAAPTRR